MKSHNWGGVNYMQGLTWQSQISLYSILGSSSHVSLFLFFLKECVHVCVCERACMHMHIHMSPGVRRVHKRVLGPWALGTKLGPSARAEHGLNH